MTMFAAKFKLPNGAATFRVYHDEEALAEGQTAAFTKAHAQGAVVLAVPELDLNDERIAPVIFDIAAASISDVEPEGDEQVAQGDVPEDDES